MAAAVRRRPDGLEGRAAADDHQTTIPKTDERVSRNRKRDEQCHEGGNEPPDRHGSIWQAGQPPQELQAKHTWRTREDPLAEIWPQARGDAGGGAGFGGQGLFEYLWERSPWAVQEKHLRTFQRRVKLWRLAHGPDKEVFFPQDWEAGRAMQLDWTNANELAVTIAGRPYDHLLCHCVLPHSNWDWATPLSIGVAAVVPTRLAGSAAPAGQGAAGAADRQQQRGHAPGRGWWDGPGVQRAVRFPVRALRAGAPDHRHRVSQRERGRGIEQRTFEASDAATLVVAGQPGFRIGSGL